MQQSVHSYRPHIFFPSLQKKRNFVIQMDGRKSVFRSGARLQFLVELDFTMDGIAFSTRAWEKSIRHVGQCFPDLGFAAFFGFWCSIFETLIISLFYLFLFTVQASDHIFLFLMDH
ncbi:hypothetical protein NC651_009494 [Populus alba x Populus x berolinensis]|nr:hypothetical protein NC651_009494 [Populus alba x Populus x berolinensis]